MLVDYQTSFSTPTSKTVDLITVSQNIVTLVSTLVSNFPHPKLFELFGRGNWVHMTTEPPVHSLILSSNHRLGDHKGVTKVHFVHWLFSAVMMAKSIV